ncbi:MAG TPA: zinc-binding alcohol dehydrogenase family protein [Hanamia sp.]|nr:zinc-binding alcohol dehydrogenase family protein [Hanamia sp.]
MKTLVCVRPGLFEYKTGVKPQAAPDHSIIKIKKIGVCGTDLHAFEGTQPFFEYPRVLGHELAGELVSIDNAPGFQVGEAVTFVPYFSCGECIACRNGKPNCCSKIKVCGVHQDGGMVEYLSVPSSSLIHGQGLTFDELALVEPLSIGAHGIRRAGIVPGEFVLVAGVGPIGLAALVFGREAGAKIIALDVDKNRLRFCKDTLKVDHTVNALDKNIVKQLMDMTGGDMPTVVIDASGNLNAINNGFKYMAHGGRYVLIGLQKDDIHFSHPEFHKREATLLSSRNATRDDFEYVIEQIKSKQIDPKDFITTHVLFENVKAEFGRWLSPDAGVIKAMIEIS